MPILWNSDIFDFFNNHVSRSIFEYHKFHKMTGYFFKKKHKEFQTNHEFAHRELAGPHLIPNIQITVRDRQQQLSRMIELYLEGLTYSEIAKQIPCSENTVYKRLSAAGLGRYKSHNKK